MNETIKPPEIIDGQSFIISRSRTRVVIRENQVLNHSGNKGYGRSNKEAKLNNESTISPEAKAKKSAYKLNVRIKQKSKNFRELAWNNFDKNNSQMLTVTFDPKLESNQDLNGKSLCNNLNFAYREFKKFMQRMNYKYDNLCYLAVFDVQNKYNWHFHILINLPDDVKDTEIKEIWKNGRVSISRIRGNESMFRGEVDYLVKNMTNSIRYLNDHMESKGAEVHSFFRSKNLKHDIALNSWDENRTDYDGLLDEIRSTKPTYKPLYTTTRLIGTKNVLLDNKDTEVEELINFGALYTEDMLQYGIQHAYNVNRYLSLSQTYLQERFPEPYQATRKARGCLKK
jgi:hypothetical protein